MLPELGHFATIFAFVLTCAQSVAATLGASRASVPLHTFAVRAARAQCALLASAFCALAWSFVVLDFSVRNVATNAHSQLPLAYRFAATWGSHEGSLLLWTLMLGLWTAALTRFTRQVPTDMVGRVLAVLGAISAGFLSFMLTTSNPFARLAPTPSEGLDLNPLLQDLAMILHPPLLYMGYVGFSVAFAFAIAALWSRRLDAVWARWSRPWTTAAWLFLTCGIALGSFWAYYELGWGGWWFWDPVENASFMPWLVGTALIHSLAVTDKRGAFRSWTVLLAIATFSLSLLGAFLVRSGVLTSVHAFATDPARGIFLLLFLVVVVGGSLLLYAVRASVPAQARVSDPLSRESLLLVNNVLLTVAAASVLLGTVYPLVVDVLGQPKLSVGPPYFNVVFVVLMIPTLFVMGLGPLARWRTSNVSQLVARARWALPAGICASLAVTLVSERWDTWVVLGLTVAFWIVLATAFSVSDVLMVGGWQRMRYASPPRSYYGMHLAHAGVAVTVLGITVVTGYQTEADLRMGVGETTALAGYEFQLRGVSDVNGPNYTAARAVIEVRRGRQGLGNLYPEKRVYASSGNAMTEAAIDSGIFRHLYVSLGEPLDDGAWRVRIQHKPFVGWIWAGAVLMAVGGGLAMSDRRYRLRHPGGQS